MAAEIPLFWKSRMEDVDRQLEQVRLGKVRQFSTSAGKRPIHVVEYGDKQDLKRTANYNSACGANDPSYYAKKGPDIKPIILLIGGIHGGEFEGIVSLLNLLQMIETGTDYRGKRWDYLYENWSRFRLLVIPNMNPDGRARVPLDTMVGESMHSLRYHVQGTWKDGSYCDWPACKAVHPILDHVEVLGGYFNDDGINLMHDNFFSPMANETKDLFTLVDHEAPDFTIGLHGGGDCTNFIIPAPYAAPHINERMNKFDRLLADHCAARKLRYRQNPVVAAKEPLYPPRSYNLTSAIHHICGGISLTYESNMGLNTRKDNYTYDEILDSHFTLFESIFQFYSVVQ